MLYLFQRSFDLYTRAPITIGNIPLRSEWGNIAPPSMIPIMAPPVAPVPPGELPPAGMMPPPMPSPYPPTMYPPPGGEGLPPMYPPSTGAGQPSIFPPPGSMGQHPPGFSSDMDYATNFGPGPMQPTAPTVVAPYPDMPPPTYNERYGSGTALKDDDDNDHIRSQLYKPHYPTYTWNK